jgi:hypothetical protein
VIEIHKITLSYERDLDITSNVGLATGIATRPLGEDFATIINIFNDDQLALAHRLWRRDTGKTVNETVIGDTFEILLTSHSGHG